MRILGWSIQRKDQVLSSAELNSDLTVVLARDEGAKSAFLSFVEQILPSTGNGHRPAQAQPWTGHLLLGTPSGTYKLEPSRLGVLAGARPRPESCRTDAPGKPPHLVYIRAADTGELAALDGRSIAERLLGPGGVEGSGAADTLRTRAERLLRSGGGQEDISGLVARLADVDGRLAAARGRERASAEAIDALLGDEGTAEISRQRFERTAERDHVAALLRIWPRWQDLGAAQSQLAALTPYDDSLARAETRFDELVERRAGAENGCRILRRRLAQLLHELESVRTKESLSRIAERARHNADELPAYRDRLLHLAATRARLSDLDHEIAAAPAALGAAWDVSMATRFDGDAGASAELAEWQRRIRSAQDACVKAERELAAIRNAMQGVCAEVTEHLGDAPDGEQDEIDTSWRALWRLRANVEDIWLVQSRGEASARTLQDREAALRAAESSKHWIPPARLGDLLSLLIVIAGGCFAARASVRNVFDAAILGALTLMALAARLAVHGRSNWVQREQRKTRAGAQKLRGEVEDLRALRDADWKRAAALGEAIRTDGARLGFSGPPAPEAIDECEQELARRLRTHGARTPLGRRLLELLEAQDEEQTYVARLTAADEAKDALLEQWESWRISAGLPDGVDADTAAERLARLRALSATIASRDTTRSEMHAMEPEIAAWEAGARGLLAEVGVEVPPDLCGRALATELTVLQKRVERNDERSQRRANLEVAITGAEQNLAESEADLALVGGEWAELVAAAGASDDADLEGRVAALRRRREVERRIEEIQSSIDSDLGALDDPARARAELASGAVEQWEDELQRCELQLVDAAQSLAASEERWRDAAPALSQARDEVEVADLLLERQMVLAALNAAAHEWRLVVIARGLIEESIEERESARRREVLGSASRMLAGLSGSAYTAVVSDGKSGGLALIRGDGTRVLADGHLDATTMGRLHLSMRLGHAAQLASRGSSLPVILDDVLAPFAPADRATVAKEIAAVARGNQVLYLTTNAESRAALSCAAGAVPLLEI